MKKNDHTNYKWEERADYISNEQLNMWTVKSDHFLSVVEKIEAPGAKLFVGPRGSGKTHLMRYAYNECINADNKPFPLYVTFGKYFNLEPFLTQKANAQIIFHVWVLLKLLISVQETTKALGQIDDDLELWHDAFDFSQGDVSIFINNAEMGLYEGDEISEKILKSVNISSISSIIRDACKKCNRKRTILLLDDAALTLTPEYLIEFFDIVRTIKSRDISPKVSVYPGTTEYGPRFHVGQDALPVNVWNIDLSDSHTLMKELFKKRLQGSKDDIPDNVLQLFMIVAFGIPRAFITMVSSYIDADSGTAQKRFNQVIEDQSKYLEIEYLSQSQKLKQYENIIHIGKKLFDTVIEKLVQINKSSPKTKQVIVGLRVDNNEVDLLQERMIRFLVEAGLLHPEGKVSHGEGRIYERYTPHLIFLLKNRAFSAKSRGFNPKAILEFLARKNFKHPQREELSKLLSSEEIQSIKLNLPPCSSCGTTRITDSQKFCHHCGNELINESKFYRCMKISIDDVPGITTWRKERIREGTNLKTIGDLYSHSQPAAELCKAFGIGKVKSEDTYQKVERYIEEFLS